MNIITDLSIAFLSALHGDQEICFRWFDDAKLGRVYPKIITLKLTDALPELQRMNRQGAGIFHTINQTDGKGGGEKNIIGLNALAADYDSVEPTNLEQLPEPSAILQSKNGKHLYWFLLPGQPLELFTPYQTMLAELTGGDEIVKDLPRVLRTPGFLHQKDPDDPFLVEVLSLHPEFRYSLSDFPTPTIQPASTKTRQKTTAIRDSSNLKEMMDVVELLVPFRPSINLTKERNRVKKILSSASLGNGANSAILRASSFAFNLLLDNSTNLKQKQELILDVAESIYSGQNSEVKWNREKAANTINDGLKYVAKDLITLLTDEDLPDERITCTESFVSDMGIDVEANKITAIRSEMGTGKTTYLNSLVTAALNNNQPVVIIAHRLALIEQWKQSIQVDSVQIRTVDSLAYLSIPKNALVILDEADQLLEYLFLCTETSVQKRRKECIEQLTKLCQKAKSIILSSAHLTNLEVEVIRKLIGWDNVSTAFYINQQKQPGKQFIRIPSKLKAVTQIEQLLEKGEKVYVALDSARSATQLAEHFKQFNPVLLTAATKDLLLGTDINSLAVSTKLLITSPTVGTGIDINVDYFDAVVGIFTNSKQISYQSCLQAINRVRKVKTFYVHIQYSSPNGITGNIELPAFDINLSSLTQDINVSELLKPYDLLKEAEWIREMQRNYLIRNARGKLIRSVQFWNAVKRQGHKLDVADNLYSAEIEPYRNEPTRERNDRILAASDLPPHVLIKGSDELMRYKILSALNPQYGGLVDGLGLRLTDDEINWYFDKGRRCLAVLSYLRAGREGCLMFDAEFNSGSGLSSYGFIRAIDVYDILVPLFRSLVGVIESGSFTSQDLEALRYQIEKAGIQRVRDLGIKVNLKQLVITATQLLSLLGYETHDLGKVKKRVEQPKKRGRKSKFNSVSASQLLSIEGNQDAETELNKVKQRYEQRRYSISQPLFLSSVLAYFSVSQLSEFWQAETSNKQIPILKASVRKGICPILYAFKPDKVIESLLMFFYPKP